MDSTSESVSSALQGCLEACRRCEVLVNLVLNERGGQDVFLSLGPHLRHCLDHFTCLIRGLETGIVDYDARDRSSTLETSPSALLNSLHQITAEVARLEGTTAVRSLDVVQLAAPGRSRQRVASTLERELIFLSSHTVHHLAVMVEIAAAWGLELPRALGVAFSTAAYLAQAEAASA